MGPAGRRVVTSGAAAALRGCRTVAPRRTWQPMIGDAASLWLHSWWIISIVHSKLLPQTSYQRNAVYSDSIQASVTAVLVCVMLLLPAMLGVPCPCRLARPPSACRLSKAAAPSARTSLQTAAPQYYSCLTAALLSTMLAAASSSVSSCSAATGTRSACTAAA